MSVTPNSKKGAKAQKAYKEPVVKDEVPGEAPQASPSAGVSREKYFKDRDRHDKAVASFLPEVREFFKENLGIDFEQLDTRALYDIMLGKMTRPLDMTVTPLAYDGSRQERIPMPKVHAVASLIVNLPKENGRFVAPDDDHKIWFQTVPCRPLVEKVEGFVPDDEQAPAEESGTRENIEFTEAQKLALEGIGIDRTRLFPGYNAIPYEVKKDMAEGRPFAVDGVLKTSFGFVNVSGVGALRQDGKGSVRAMFEPNIEEKPGADRALDIIGARRIGMLELDIFKRDTVGRMIKDVNGMPVLNEAGSNLVEYGMALMPVRGYEHKRAFNKQTGKYEDQKVAGWYQVTAFNGSLIPKKMKVIKTREGKEASERLEVADVRINHEKAQVFVDGRSGEPLTFKTQRDMFDFLEGRGGVVTGATFETWKDRKKEVVKYDAFVAPDNRRGGYAHQFSPENTKKLLQAREWKEAVAKARKPKKQNYSPSL